MRRNAETCNISPGCHRTAEHGTLSRTRELSGTTANSKTQNWNHPCTLLLRARLAPARAGADTQAVIHIPLSQLQALRQAMARLAIHLVSGPAGVAAILRRGLLDKLYNSPSLPLDIG